MFLNVSVTTAFIGGLPILEDVRHAKKCHIAVGTPGMYKYLTKCVCVCSSTCSPLVEISTSF